MIAVDASVWVSLLTTADVNHSPSRRWYERWLETDDEMTGTPLLLAEVAGAISRLLGDAAAVEGARQQLAQAQWLQIVPLDIELGSLAESLAAQLRMRGSDATYVALAFDLGIPLVTWDNEQIERGSHVIDVFSPASFPWSELPE